MDHHHHHHQDAVTTTMPTVTTMVVNALINTTNQMMAMAQELDSHDHHDHHNHVTEGDMNGHNHTTDHGGHEGHDGQEGHDGHVGSVGHGMDMTFHASVSAKILFEEWNVTTVGGLVGSVVGIFIMALLYEGLKFMREYLYREHFNAISYSSVAVMGQDGKTKTELHKITTNRIFGWPHILQTSLHMVQILVSYFLMLIFMTYNVWLCLAVLLGSGLGYFFFGWKKATIVDISEHCH